MDRSIEEIQSDRAVDLLADNKCQAERIKLLEDLLGDLYDDASYEWAGEWVIDNKDLQKRIKQALV